MSSSNRVKQLAELWGQEKGLQLAMASHRRAHEHGFWFEAMQWQLEIQAYRDAKLIAFKPSEEITFRPHGPAKVLAFAK